MDTKLKNLIGGLSIALVLVGIVFTLGEVRKNYQKEPLLGGANDRYWVGGSGNWSDDDNHWATSTGGAPADGNLPSDSLNCVFDTNSGLDGEEITMDVEEPNCKDFTSNTDGEYSIIYNAGDLEVYGNFVGEDGLTFDAASEAYTYFSAPGDATIESNKTNFFHIIVDSTGTTTLLGDLGVGITNDMEFDLQNGSFDANDYDIGAKWVYLSTESTTIMGNGIWEITGQDDNDDTFVVSGGGELIAESSTIKLNVGSGFGTFKGGDKTYNNVWFSGAAEYYIENDYNIFNELRIGPALTVNFPVAYQTVSKFIASGYPSNNITLLPVDLADGFELKQIGGIVCSDYIDISSSTFYSDDEGNTSTNFYAGSHSVDGGNNDGWTFSDCPATNTYWVGGAGNWEDAQTHWAFSSGGAPQYNAMPNSSTNCYFDSNSGIAEDGIVTFSSDATVGECKDLYFTTGLTRWFLNRYEEPA